MDKNQARIEAKKIIDECIKKEEAIEKEAKRNGIWLPGLDSNHALFREVEKERNEKLAALASMVDKEE